MPVVVSNGTGPFVFNADRKTSHTASKSSKNKKSKQKGKGKGESTDKESWRQETAPKPEHSAVDAVQGVENSSDRSKETELTSSIQTTESKPGFVAATIEEEQIVKTQDEMTEKEVALAEIKEGNEDVGTELKAEVMSEIEVNPADTCSANEKKMPAVIFKQEQVVPLRSRGEYFFE